MRDYILQRLAWALPTLLVITAVSYGIMRLAPGDPIQARYLGGQGEAASTVKESQGLSDAGQLFRKRFHLDKPWYEGYWRWLGAIVTEGDFGVSVTINIGRPVWEMVRQRLPATLKLNLWSMAFIYLIAIPAGIYSAVRRDTLLDRASTLLFFVLYSLPSFWVGLLLILLASTYAPSWPVSGLAPQTAEGLSYGAILCETAKHYVLPVFCLSYGAFASLSRYTRVGLLEVVRQDYIRTARAKGCGEARVILKHALRNGLIPLVVLFAGLLPGLVGGSIIVEYLFDINGMGDLSLTALSSRDYPVLMTLFAFGSALTLVGLLLSDVLLALVDPRISFDKRD